MKETVSQPRAMVEPWLKRYVPVEGDDRGLVDFHVSLLVVVLVQVAFLSTGQAFEWMS